MPSKLPKMSQGAQNKKIRPDALGTAENRLESAKHETGPDALGSAKNESGSAKNLKRDPTRSVPPKTSAGAQNIKTRPDVLGTVENQSKSAKQEGGTRHPRYN
jgi:hypothetical protein